MSKTGTFYVISGLYRTFLFRWDLYSVIYGLVVLQRRRTDIRLPRLAVYDINHTLNPINSADSWNRTTDLTQRSVVRFHESAEFIGFNV